MAQRKSLLVLGASEYQLETITTAQRLGCRVICSDNVSSNPGHRIADKSYAVDTTDREGILWVAREEKVDGVIAPCTDVAVPTAAFVAGRMGLSGPPLKASEVVCDKLAFREFLQSHGFPAPRFLALPAQLHQLDSIFNGRRWIVKPDCSSGSKGVFIIGSRAELQARLPETMAFSPSGCAILEEFLDGFQGTCEGIIQHGKIVLACILDRQTVAPPYVATCGHRVPTSLPEDVQCRIVAKLEKLWRLLRVTDAVFDCDFVICKDKVQILEMSPRLGGNCVGALLFKSGGFDFAQYAIRLVCGESPQPPQPLTLQPMAVMILGSPKGGRLRYDESELKSLEQNGWIESLKMDLAPGSEVEPFINGRHRIGECFLRGSDYDDVVAKSGEVLTRLGINVTPMAERDVSGQIEGNVALAPQSERSVSHAGKNK